MATGYLQNHLLADTGVKKSKDITSVPAAPDLGASTLSAFRLQTQAWSAAARAQVVSQRHVNAPDHMLLFLGVLLICSRDSYKLHSCKGSSPPIKEQEQCQAAVTTRHRTNTEEQPTNNTDDENHLLALFESRERVLVNC